MMTSTINLPWPTLDRVFLVGLGHKARQGKDTACAAILARFPEARRVAFADAVRAVCRVNHGMTAKDAPLLQQIGVGRRQTDPDLWVRTAAWTIHDWQADQQGVPSIVVIPDVRFPNEVQFIKRHGGLMVRIERLRADGSPYIADDRPATHISETALTGKDFDLTLPNPEGRSDLLRDRIGEAVKWHFWAWTERL